MAHNLNFNEKTGQYSFYTVREKAWHSLGHISDKYENSTEVLKKAQLDYTVNKDPLTYNFPSGKSVISDQDFYTYRTDTEEILGTGVGKDYTIVQNVEAFTFFDAIAKGEGILYETAGALGKGERIFITAKLPSYIRVGKDDIIENYLFLTLSHDGKSSIVAALTPTRIVCNNTLNAAMSDCSNIIRLRHTPNVQDQLKEAHKIMGMVNTLTPLLEQTFNHWAKVKIKDEQVKRLIEIAMAPDKESLDNIRDKKEELNSAKYKNMVFGALGYAIAAESQKLETTEGTLFGAYNAVTGYFQNVRSYKNAKDKIDSVIYGGMAQKKAQATFQLCQDFAKHGEDALMLN